MKKLIILLVVVVSIVAANQMARAAEWTFYFDSGYIDPGAGVVCPGGKLTVHATINCVKQGAPIYEGDVVREQAYSGVIPGEPINDWVFKFDWNYICNNEDHYKLALPGWQWDPNSGDPSPGDPYPDDPNWAMASLTTWLDNNLPEDGIGMPTIGDPTGTIQHIYLIADPSVWLHDPRVIQDTYFIIDGECEDLPGYLIGTTPIIFDPNAGPDDNPFSTTPLTGMLYSDGELTLTPSSRCGQWGYSAMDFNRDCRVNLTDFATIALEWLVCTMPDEVGCVYRDTIGTFTGTGFAFDGDDTEGPARILFLYNDINAGVIEPNDIILEYRGQAVSTGEELLNHISAIPELGSGQKVYMTIDRASEIIEIILDAGEYPFETGGGRINDQLRRCKRTDLTTTTGKYLCECVATGTQQSGCYSGQLFNPSVDDRYLEIYAYCYDWDSSNARVNECRTNNLFIGQ
jgi:hypothetical protein